MIYLARKLKSFFQSRSRLTPYFTCFPTVFQQLPKTKKPAPRRVTDVFFSNCRALHGFICFDYSENINMEEQDVDAVSSASIAG
jgi:hypothetical protein